MNITPLAQLALLFSTLLLPGTQALLAPTTPDAGSALNLTFDPWTRTLTWACDTAAGNVTVTSCTVTSREAGIHRRVSPFGCRCWFRRMMALHHGVTLDVNGTVGGAAAHWRLSFVNEGGQGRERPGDVIARERRQAMTSPPATGVVIASNQRRRLATSGRAHGGHLVRRGGLGGGEPDLRDPSRALPFLRVAGGASGARGRPVLAASPQLHGSRRGAMHGRPRG